MKEGNRKIFKGDRAALLDRAGDYRRHCCLMTERIWRRRDRRILRETSEWFRTGIRIETRRAQSTRSPHAS